MILKLHHETAIAVHIVGKVSSVALIHVDIMDTRLAVGVIVALAPEVDFGVLVNGRGQNGLEFVFDGVVA